MRMLGWLVLIISVLLLSACSYFRAENPLNIKCSSCGYIWDRSVDHTPEQQLREPIR